MKEFKKDKLSVRVHENRTAMGEDAAIMVGKRILELLTRQECVNIIFAAAPSQDELLRALAEQPLEFGRINAFHMDEYIGLQLTSPQSFRQYLDSHIFNKRTFRSVHYLDGNSSDSKKECARYSALLQRYPTDIVCMGIGENGHIAFNDPHTADFKDKELVKVVDLDEVSRQQQVNDGCFINIDLVPRRALTLTIPALIAGRFLFCVVPGPTKVQAIANTLHRPIHPAWPATVLREHQDAILFLDNESLPDGRGRDNGT